MIKKKWTVIMYLNGNNELAIEMENTFKDVCNVKSDPSTTTILGGLLLLDFNVS